MLRKLSFIPLIIKSALFFLALFLISLVIHECAHLLLAIIMKVPIVSFTWFDSYYLTPVLFTETTDNSIALMVIGYAGGLVAGGLYLTILILKRRWFRQSLPRWILGCCLVTIGLWEVSMGIMEGLFHSMYINDAINNSGITYGIVYFSAIAGIGIYCFTMPIPPKVKTTENQFYPTLAAAKQS